VNVIYMYTSLNLDLNDSETWAWDVGHGTWDMGHADMGQTHRQGSGMLKVMAK